MTVLVRVRDGLEPSGGGDGGVTEGDFRGGLFDLVTSTGGVVDLAGGHGEVTENAPLAMTVLVDDGIIYVPNSSFDELDTDQIRCWEVIISNEDALVIGPNSSGSTRIDLICVKLDTSIVPNEFASNIATLVVVAGTPGAGAPATPNDHYKLAQVEVADGETEIDNANITDSRAQLAINSDFLGSIEAVDLGVSTLTVSELLRVNAGGTAIESSGQTIPTGDIVGTSDTQTLTNKRVTKRVTDIVSSATPTVDTDDCDAVDITALAAAITSMTSNLSGTPTNKQTLIYQILDDGTGRAITWGASFEAKGVALPTTTTANKMLTVGFIYDTTAAKWGCVASVEEA